MKTGTKATKNLRQRLVALLLGLCMFLTIGTLTLTNVAKAAGVTEMQVIVRHWIDANIVFQENRTLAAADGSLDVTPLEDWPELGLKNENFKAFSVAAGQSAVTIDKDNPQKAIVSFDENTPVVKVHVYYSEPYAASGAGNKTPNNTIGENPTETDTLIVDPDGKEYSTKEGLHTDKTAEAITNFVENNDGTYDDDTDNAADSRAFNLTLEAWSTGLTDVNVGLVLDASGSMAFISDASLLDPLTAADAEPGSNLPTGQALSSTEIDQILDKRLTDDSLLGYSGYQYYIFDPRDNTGEFGPLGYWGGKIDTTTNGGTSVYARHYAKMDTNNNLIDVSYDDDKSTVWSGYTTDFKGWYYVSSNGNKINQFTTDDTLSKPYRKGLETAKQFRCMHPDYSNYLDYVAGRDDANLVKNTDGTKYFDGSKIFNATGNSYKYASIFYISKDDVDENGDGYLHCIYNVTSKYYMDSRVYKKQTPSTRIKAEELQNALGNFVNELNTATNQSHVSAVRFSTDAFNNDPRRIDELFMLDWTTDPKKSTVIMNQTNGKTETKEAGAFDCITDEKGKKCYNYVFTGGTSAYTGLFTFQQKLASTVPNGNDKYIILFTDGIDDDLSKKDELSDSQIASKPAVITAGQLKADEYKIYTVMLKGGFEYDSAGGKNAVKFLNAIASDGRYYEAEDATDLNNKFQEILNDIINSEYGYSVKDYVDPRFDLYARAEVATDLDGNPYYGTRGTIHLDKDGNVSFVNTMTKKTADYYKRYAGKAFDNGGEATKSITLTPIERANEKLTDKERANLGLRVKLSDGYNNATLRYSRDKELYYLEWENQSIPVCTTELDKVDNEGNPNGINVWKRTIQIVAKEDFIGGNAVLTNGNDKDMNMVFHPNDLTTAEEFRANAGTSDAVKNTPIGNRYVSKGFPRTTVNVQLKTEKMKGGNQLIYMGESISPKALLDELVKTLNVDKTDATFDQELYLDYLKRYVQWSGQSQYSDWDALMQAVVNASVGSGNSTLKIPYSYLPDLNDTNQTGKRIYEEDVLGNLVFEWVHTTPTGAVRDDGKDERKDDYVTKDTLDRTYTLKFYYEPYPDPNPNSTEGTTGTDKTKRVDENDTLITDKNYENVKSPEGTDIKVKDAVGKEQKKKDDLSGTHLTEIVRGELALKLEAKLDDLYWMFTRGPWSGEKEKAFYTTYGNGQTLKVTVTWDAVEKAWKDRETKGNTFEDFSYTYDVDPQKATGANSGLLSLGTYTMSLSNDQKTQHGFNVTLDYASRPTDYANHFTRTAANKHSNDATDKEAETGVIIEGADESTYYAPEGGPSDGTQISFYLGSKKDEYKNDADKTNDGKYLNERLGMGLIKLDLSASLTLSKVMDENTLEGKEDEVYAFNVTLYERNDAANSLQGLSKKLTGKQEYTYTINRTTETGTQTDTGKIVFNDGEIISATADSGASVINDDNQIVLKAGESIDITGMPAGTYYEIEEVLSEQQKADHIKFINVTNTGSEREKSGSKIAGGVSNPGAGQYSDKVTFTNRYNPNVAAVIIEGTKRIIDDVVDLEKGDFTFQITPISGKDENGKDIPVEEIPMPAEGATAANEANGSFQFGEIEYTEPGEFVYHVTEINDEKNGYIYDESIHTVTVTVERDENKALNATYTIDGSADNDLEFENGFEVVPPFLELHKYQALNEGEKTQKPLKAEEGDIVTYYISVTNTGTAAATDVVVTDKVPEGLKLVKNSISDNGVVDENGVITWDLGTLKGQESREVSFKVRVPDVADYTQWKNVASATWTDPKDPDNPPDPSESEEVKVEEEAPNVTIRKSQAVVVDRETGETTKPTEDKLTVQADDVITYYLTVSSDGKETAKNVQVKDTVPQTPVPLTLVEGSISDNGKVGDDGITIYWSLGDMEPGDSKVVSFQVTVPYRAERTKWVNISYVAYDNDPTVPHDPEDPDDPDNPDNPDDPSDPGNPDDPDNPDGPDTEDRWHPSNPVESEEDVPVVVIHKAQARINETPSTEKRAVVPGDVITYTLKVTNQSDAHARNVVVSDTVPQEPIPLQLVEGSISDGGVLDDDGITIHWDLGTLPAGETKTVTFQITVPDVEETTTWANIGYVTYDNPANPPETPNQPIPSEEVEIEFEPEPGELDNDKTPEPDQTPTNDNRVPPTGDQTPMGLWIGIASAAAAGVLAAVICIIVRKKHVGSTGKHSK